MSFVDYYKLKNLQADSAMREGLANDCGCNKVKPVLNVNDETDNFFE